MNDCLKSYSVDTEYIKKIQSCLDGQHSWKNEKSIVVCSVCGQVHGNPFQENDEFTHFSALK